MATINVQLDVTGVNVSLADSRILAKTKIGFLSSIKPDLILQTAFIVGTGFSTGNIDIGVADPNSYNPNKIKGIRDTQKNTCLVIATVGGSITSTAVGGDTGQTYVSLVSSADTVTDPNIKGGVSLNSYQLNPARKNYLKNLAGGLYGDANIFLYENPNSQMQPLEAKAWGIAGTIILSAAGLAGGTNDATKFANDVAAGGPLDPNNMAGPKGLIISDDPFFRLNRGELIKCVNMWLQGDASRYVVYPSQIYGSPIVNDLAGAPQQPMAGQSTLYGPDLVAAYSLLGTIARCCYDNSGASPGFISATPIIVAL